MQKKNWVIGTRKSALALWQAEHVAQMLRTAFPTDSFTLLPMSTTGDQILDRALYRIGEKSLFTKELEVALAAGDCDLVVHSLKDVPTALPEGMALGGVCARHDPRDALIVAPRHAERGVAALGDLPPDATVGTSSVRRQAQLRRRHAGLAFADVRGNLQTRLAKLDAPDGPYDALVLALAGVERLGLGARVAAVLDADELLPAVGQGALAIEIRADDAAARALAAAVTDRPTLLAVTAERAFMRELEGGCSVPLGALSRLDGDGAGRTLSLSGCVCALDGSAELRVTQTTVVGDSEDAAAALGRAVAQSLLDRGARALLPPRA